MTRRRKTMSYRLFLDDVRNPEEVKWVRLPSGPWTVIRNYEDFVRVVQNRGMPEYISFDHDLADVHYQNPERENFVEKTGLDCAKWLVEHCSTFGYGLPEYSVHSMNPVGAERIRLLLQSFKQNHIK